MKHKLNKAGQLYLPPTAIKSPYSPTANIRNIQRLEKMEFADGSFRHVWNTHTVAKERVRSKYTPHVGKKQLAKTI